MKPLAALAALVLTVGATMVPTLARDTYVIDDAHLLSAGAISQINAKVGDFNAQTHKEVIVSTEPTGSGASIDAMAEKTFAQHQINGVLILITKQPKAISVSVDHASTRFFPPGSTASIRQAMVSAFNSGDFDGGVNNGVDLALSQFRSHLGSLRTTTHAVPVQNITPVRNETGGGFNMSIILWIVALVVIFSIVRGIFRAMSRPRMMPPGYGSGGMGGPMGGPGYGPGYGGGGMGGGGGGFFSGMLGGLGGAFLGNELFGNRGGFGGNTYDGNQAGMVDGQAQDASGWQNDAGQIDTGASSSGSWGGGDSGGGGGWGGGDSGGGGGWGGGDSGGGGGDSGGGGW